jgi:hypothetical protein
MILPIEIMIALIHWSTSAIPAPLPSSPIFPRSLPDLCFLYILDLVLVAISHLCLIAMRDVRFSSPSSAFVLPLSSISHIVRRLSAVAPETRGVLAISAPWYSMSLVSSWPSMSPTPVTFAHRLRDLPLSELAPDVAHSKIIIYLSPCSDVNHNCR